MARFSLLMMVEVGPPSFSNCSVYFFTDTPAPEIYTLSLHDALPIRPAGGFMAAYGPPRSFLRRVTTRSEEHTSELQSRQYIVCRLPFEKTKHWRKPSSMRRHWPLKTLVDS